MRALLFVVLAMALATKAFYLPGVAPVDYHRYDTVNLRVNKLTSIHTQIPYRFYDLPFCFPQEGEEDARENLGELLMGDRIANSDYMIEAGVDSECKLLCTTKIGEKRDQKSNIITAEDIKTLSGLVEEQYRVHWIVDNLPGATKIVLQDANKVKTTRYEDGFPLGEKGSRLVPASKLNYLHNHVTIKILYHSPEGHKDTLRIVGFEVEPSSVKHGSKVGDDGVPETCYARRDVEMMALDPEHPEDITYTYSVLWVYRADIPWASRWDTYWKMTDSQIHWFSIINSLMIVIFLTGMVAMIMMRTLHADLRRYQELESQEEAQEETGWKLVHGDVFRPPVRPMLLSVLVGSGVQVFAQAFIVMVFAVLGFLSPANRGGLLTATLIVTVIMGSVAGYYSARTYKLFKGQQWKKNTLITAMLFPSIIFATLLLLNIVLDYYNASNTISLKVFFGLVALWFGVSVPLTYAGAYFGFKKPPPEQPVRTNQIPRQIPEQVWYMQPIFSILMGGILPFGAIFIELFFILSSIWLHRFYYLFGFLFIVFFILIITCAEITIVMCYFQLCSEDYQWWWRAFLTSGASALYVLLYATFYHYTKLDLDKLAASVIFFGYTFIMSLGFFLLTGCIGFYSCYWFVRKIYSQVKVD